MKAAVAAARPERLGGKSANCHGYCTSVKSGCIVYTSLLVHTSGLKVMSTNMRVRLHALVHVRPVLA